MYWRKVFVFLLSCFGSSLYGMHHANRFFTFLEIPKPYSIENSSELTSNVFYTNATTAFNNNREKIAIPRLFGEYDLNDVISGLQEVTEKVNESTFENPFITIGGAEGQKFTDKSIKYEIRGKVKSIGFSLQHDHKLYKNFSFGFYLPFMQVISSQEFFFKMYSYRPGTYETSTGIEPLQSGELSLINKVRHKTHDLLGLAAEDFVKFGPGDLDIYLRMNNSVEYSYFMRSINFENKLGLIIPMGVKRDFDNSAALPFMGDGHAGIYFQTNPEFELKQDFKVGLMLGYLTQLKKTKRFRLPVADEPYLFSALTGPVESKPGYVLKFSPYFTLAGLADGFSGQIRLTHLRHGRDKIKDVRVDSEKVKLASNLDPVETNSKWVANLITFQVMYDSKEASKVWGLSPKLLLTYDFPFDWLEGRRSIRTSKITLGMELHF